MWQGSQVKQDIWLSEVQCSKRRNSLCSIKRSFIVINLQCSFALPWLIPSIRDDKDLIWNNAKYTGWLEIPHSSLAPPLGHRKDSQSVHKPNYAMKEKGVAQTRLSLMNFCRCQMCMRMNCWKDYWRGFASNIPLNY